jgi:hypothetical protein
VPVHASRQQENSMTEQVYYHVADQSYIPHQPLLSWSTRFEHGNVESYEYRWSGMGNQGYVSFFKSLEEAVAFAEDYGGCILRVHLADSLDLTDEDGYPAALGQIWPMKIELLAGMSFPGPESEPDQESAEYLIRIEAPEHQDHDVPEVIVRIFQASDGLYFFCEDLGANFTGECDGFQTAYQATIAADAHFGQRGERIKYLTHDASEKAARELGLAIELACGRFLIPHKLLPMLN